MDWWQELFLRDLPAASVAILHAFFKAWSALFLFVLFWKFVRIVNSATNKLEWSDLISSRGLDGEQHVDVTKIGLCVMVIESVWLPAVYVYSSKMDGYGLAAVMGASASTLGAVAYGVAYLRAKQPIPPKGDVP